MKSSSREKLIQALEGKKILGVNLHGGHGMVLTFNVLDPKTGRSQTIDICSYDDGKKHTCDEFYVGIDGQELPWN